MFEGIVEVECVKFLVREGQGTLTVNFEMAGEASIKSVGRFGGMIQGDIDSRNSCIDENAVDDLQKR